MSLRTTLKFFVVRPRSSIALGLLFVILGIVFVSGVLPLSTDRRYIPGYELYLAFFCWALAIFLGYCAAKGLMLWLRAPVINIVCATKLSKNAFWNISALGISLRRLAHNNRLVAHIAFANERGLPDVYNERISKAGNDDMLVFIHDDIWIDDDLFAERVRDGLRNYDVIGVVGNRRKVQNQPGWAFVAFLEGKFTWDYRENLSGSLGHGEHKGSAIANFGPAPADCESLDGCFLAANANALKKNKVFFDPRFDFHFYDMDFCRTARDRGLRLGTWPIGLTHQSGGSFGSLHWEQKYREFIDKWGE